MILFYKMPIERPSWVKDKSYSEDFEVIQAKKFDPYKDWKQDDGCYVLIKIYKDSNEIGVGICDYKHNILKEFRGSKAEDIYNAIFTYSEKNNKGWFTRLDHAAYLGKELKKAETALRTGTEYFQE